MLDNKPRLLSALLGLGVLSLLSACGMFTSPEQHLDRAVEFAQDGDYRSAVVELKNVLREQPENDRARLLLAESALWLGDVTSADAELRLVKQPPDAATYAELETRVGLALGRPQDAVDSLNAATGLMPPAKIDMYMGFALLGLRQADAARISFAKALSSDPTLVMAKTGLAESLAAAGRMEDALAEAAQTVASHGESAWALYTHGVLLARNGELQKAAGPLTRARELMPRQLELLQQAAVLAALAEVQISSGELALARETSGALTQLVPGLPGALLLSSRVAIAEGKFEEASAVLRRLTNAVPTLAQAKFMLAVALLAQGNLEQAGQQLNEVVAQNPDHVESRQLLAQVRLRLKDPDGALRALVPALQGTVEATTSGAALEAVQLLASGKTAAAVEALQKIRRDDPGAVEPRLILARIALASDDAKESERLIGEAVEAAPKRSDVQNAAGLMYLATGRYDQAMSHFRIAAEIAPRDAVPWLNLGRSQLALELLPSARASLMRALELRPHWIAAAGTLAFLELQDGQREAAVARAAELKVAWPRDPSALEVEGEIRAAIRDYVGASEAFSAAMELQPDVAAYAVKAYRARLAGGVPEPARPIEKWVAGHPENDSMRLLLAEAYSAQGQFTKAVAEYERVAASQPGSPPVLNNLAWSYHQIGDVRALDVARRALAAAPGNPSILDTLGWILVEKGQLDEGARILKQASAAPGAGGDIHYHYGVALQRKGETDLARTQIRRALSDFPQFESRSKAQDLLKELGGA